MLTPYVECRHLRKVSTAFAKEDLSMKKIAMAPSNLGIEKVRVDGNNIYFQKD